MHDAYLMKKSDFSSLKSFSIGGSIKYPNYCLDSLNSNNLYLNNDPPGPADTTLYLMNLATSITSFSITASITVTAYPTLSNILNFGPYQYVVTIPDGQASVPVIFFTKGNTLTMYNTLALTFGGVSPSVVRFAGFIQHSTSLAATGIDKQYFGLVDTANKNFQSYYLTVDRCVTRDGGNVCTQCLPGFYRVTTNPNNLCQLTTEFAPGIGVDLTGLFLANPCQSVGCQSCFTDRTICQCDTANGWYLNVNVCQHATLSPQFPSAYGPNTGTGLVVACSVAHCLACSNTYSTCTGCDTGTGWFLNGNACQHATLAPQFPAGFGPNLANGLVQSCSTSHCLACPSTISTCASCDTAAGWYLNSPGCQHATLAPQFPVGYGPNTGTGNVQSCADGHCKTCSSTISTCSGCDTANGWYLNVNVCQHATLSPQFPSAYGPNTGTGLVVACSVAHCLACSNTYSTCTGCDTGTGWFLNGNACQHATLAPQFPAGFGPNLANGLVQSCSIAHCTTCSASTTSCSSCDSAAGWFLNGLSCQNYLSFPVGFGPNLVNGLVEACAVVGCSFCPIDKQVCSCDTANGFFKDPGTLACVSAASLLDQAKGGDPTTGFVTACATPHCKNCNLDYRSCTRCDTSTNHFKLASSCVSNSSLPSGQGPDLDTGEIASCKTSSCLNCSSSYSQCLACEPNLVLKGGSCEKSLDTPPSSSAGKKKISLIYANYSAVSSKASVGFNSKIKETSTIRNSLNITIIDLVLSKEYPCPPQECTVYSIDDSSFTIVLALQESITKGRLRIWPSENLQIKSAETGEFKDYPIVIPDVSFARGSAVQFLSATARFMAQAALPTSLIIAFAAPGSAGFLDTLMNNLFVLRLLEGVPVAYPDEILRNVLNLDIIPLPVDNPFEPWMERAAPCTPTEAFANADLRCSYLSNAGLSLLGVLVVLLATFVVTLTTGYIMKKLRGKPREDAPELRKTKLKNSTKHQDHPSKHKTLRWVLKSIGTFLGFQFFVVKVDATQVEALVLAGLDLKYTRDVGASIVSSTVGVAFLVYYVIICALYLRNAVWIWRSIQAKRISDQLDPQKSLREEVQLTGIPFPFLGILFFDLKTPDKFWKLLGPVISFVKNLLVGTVLSAAAPRPVLQASLLAAAEGGYLAFYASARMKAGKAETAVDIALSFFTLLYLTVKCATNSDQIGDRTRQVLLGILMAVVLGAIIITGLGYLLFVVVEGAVTAVKALLKYLRDKSKVAAANELHRRRPIEFPIVPAPLGRLAKQMEKFSSIETGKPGQKGMPIFQRGSLKIRIGEAHPPKGSVPSIRQLPLAIPKSTHESSRLRLTDSLSRLSLNREESHNTQESPV